MLASTANTESQSKKFLIIGSLALGLGIWTMHFIGSFALILPVPVLYDSFDTAASLIIAIVGSFLGFATVRFCRRSCTALVGGTIMGIGISGMHYLGMHAMVLAADMFFDRTLVVLSVLLAILVSSAGLWIVNSINSGNFQNTSVRKFFGAVMVGLAISSMHYTGMAAMSLELNEATDAVSRHSFMIGGDAMIVSLSFSAILIILFPLYSASYEKRFFERLSSELEQLRINEARLRKLIENVPDVFMVHDEQGQILDVNRIACVELGYSRTELLSLSIFDVETKFDKQNLLDAIWPSFSCGEGHRINATFIRKDGSRFPVEINITGIIEDGKKFVFALARDMTETENLKTYLSKLAMTDELTGLYNRRGFMSSLDKAVSRARRNRENLSVLMLDIDYFKNINDQFGHPMGDLALKHFSRVVSTSIRNEDVIGRLGGEEFGVLLPNTALPEAANLAEKLRITLANSPIEYEGQKISCTVSIGVADNSDEGTIPSVLVKKADRALYRAKSEGRNRVVIHDCTL